MNNRLIKSNDAGGGGCTNTVDLYNPFPDGGGVALYQLNGNADDVSGNYDGTASNVTYGTGQFGQAGVFNGSSSYINLPNLGISGSQARTISLWVKLNSIPPSSVDQLYSQGTNNNGEAFNIETTTTGKIQVSYAGKEINSTTTLSLNTWYNVVVAYKGSSVETLSNTDIYINGVQETVVDGGGVYTGIANTINSDYSLGYRRNISTLFYDGSIDQVRIFNRALRPYEVEALYTEEYCTPTIVPSEHFNTVLYTGTGATNPVTGVGFQPDFVWIKNRDTAISHALFDVVRGTPLMLRTDLTNEEVDNDNDLQLFTDEGFVVGLNTRVNQSNADMVAWCWKAGGDAVTNTDGTITSQVSANTEAGFSVVTFNSGSSTSTVGHGLGTEPNVIIYKSRSNIRSWINYHSSLGVNKYIRLNTTDEAKTETNIFATPSTTTIPNNVGASTGSNEDYIAYCFAEVEGFSNFGSYVGTGASGNTVVTGFEPAFVMLKRTDSTSQWLMYDNKRGEDYYLYPNLSAAESGPDELFQFLENGFQLTGGNADWNASGGSYIYMAFAADPTAVEPSLEDSFNTVTYTGNATARSITGVGFQPDFTWIKNRDAVQHHNLIDSVRGNTKLLYSSLTNAEATTTNHITSFDADGFSLGTATSANGNGNDIVAWNWKGAEIPAINSNGSIPSVVSANPAAGFSIVSYYLGTTGVSQTIGHGLNSEPKFIITKQRDGSVFQWTCYHESIGINKYIILNSTAAAATNTSVFPDLPTENVFTLGSGFNTTGTDMITYCFAEVAGFSKFGSYTGNGSTNGPTIDCGFEPAFVMIKGADIYPTNWNIHDNKRDTDSFNDKYLFANLSNGEVDNAAGRVIFLPNGFQIGNSDFSRNESGYNYIYMAFANQF